MYSSSSSSSHNRVDSRLAPCVKASWVKTLSVAPNSNFHTTSWELFLKASQVLFWRLDLLTSFYVFFLKSRFFLSPRIKLLMVLSILISLLMSKLKFLWCSFCKLSAWSWHCSFYFGIFCISRLFVACSLRLLQGAFKMIENAFESWLVR